MLLGSRELKPEMTLYILKVLVSALIIVAVTEVAKRGGTFWGGVLASLPLTSLLAFCWLYGETGDSARIAALSWSVFWLVLPSLTLFVALPLFLRAGFGFPAALGLALAVMIACYLATAAILRRFGIEI